MSQTLLETAGRSAFQLAFEVSPIVLSGGIATLMGGGLLAVTAILESGSFLSAALGGNVPDSLDDLFGHFVVLPGLELVKNDLGRYPMANQATAANAIIAQPRHLSMQMIAPAQGPAGYAVKLAVMTALKTTLNLHAQMGGTYIVATPASIEENAILLDLHDASGGGGGKQVQNLWQWDFEIPLITLAQANSVQSALMARITNGLPTDGALSGPANVVANPLSAATSLLGLGGSNAVTVGTTPIIQSQGLPLGPTS